MIAIAHPWFLLLTLPATGVLVWAYRNQKSGDSLLIGSLLLLQQLEQRVVFRKKFVPPPRFFVELFIFFCFVLALSGFLLKSSHETRVIVVDNSESMGHVLPSGETIFSNVQSHVSEWRKSMDAVSSSEAIQYRIFLTSPVVTEATAVPIGGDEVKRALEKLRPVAGIEKLREAVRLSTRSDDIRNALVLSDKKIKIVSSEKAQNVEAYSPAVPAGVLSNVGIEDARWLSNEGLSNEGAIEVTLRSFSTVPKKGVVSLSLVSGISEKLSWTVQRRAQRVLQPGMRDTFLFENIQKGGLFLLELQSDEDSLAADNERWLWPREEKRDVVVRSPLGIDRMGLVALPEIRYREGAPKEDAKGSPLMIVHREKEELPLTAGLYVLPLFSSEQILDAGKVVQVELQHPVLDYVDLSATTFGKVIPLTVPEWAEPLIEVEAGVIAYLGFLKGQPLVVFGFEIFPLDGEKTPTQTILYLNALKWLVENSGDASSRLVPGETLYDFSEEKNLQFASRRDPQFRPWKEKTVPQERGVLLEDGKIKGVVNFFSSEESSSQLGREITVPVSHKRHEEAEEKISVSFWLWLALVGVLLDVLLLHVYRGYAVRT